MNIAFDLKTPHHLVRLAEVTKDPIQELARRLTTKRIGCEIEKIALANIINEEDIDCETQCYLKKREDIN
ncbi:hypothetical protein GOY07_02585 [Wolbachia endosymbiont of Litomosoides sigmodontis]|nr:hypothetical protein GOY07_02585 [Wolbachia endosymbiont of Litomosoides sigmodontis]